MRAACERAHVVGKGREPRDAGIELAGAFGRKARSFAKQFEKVCAMLGQQTPASLMQKKTGLTRKPVYPSRMTLPGEAALVACGLRGAAQECGASAIIQSARNPLNLPSG